MESKNKSSLAIVLLAVGLVVGGGVGYAVNGMNDDGSNNDGDKMEAAQPGDQVAAATSEGADARVGLNNALREHVSLASEALRGVFNGDKDADAAVASLDKNSIEVAGLVGSFYGKDAEKQFLEIWRDHISFFADYTVAAKAGDKKAMDQALSDLAGYGQQASSFFADANPNLPKDAVMPLLEEHRNLVIDTVNAYGEGDFEKSFAVQEKAMDQVGTIGDALAKGTLQLNAEK